MDRHQRPGTRGKEGVRIGQILVGWKDARRRILQPERELFEWPG